MAKLNVKQLQLAGWTAGAIFALVLVLVFIVLAIAFGTYLGLALLSIWIHNALFAATPWPYDMQHILAWMTIYFIIGLVLGQIKKK
jgi:hypothetical protein